MPPPYENPGFYDEHQHNDFDPRESRGPAHRQYPHNPPPYEDNRCSRRPHSPEFRRRQTYPETRPHRNYEAEHDPRSQRRHRYDEHSDQGRGCYDGMFDEYQAARRQHRREHEDYHDDPRSTGRPRRDYYDDRPPLQGRRTVHDERRRDRPAQPRRKESKWQKEAKDLFIAYAVPVIKTEGRKYMTKKLGRMFDRK